MTAITDFYHKECEKIDPSMVNAYLELKFDPMNPTGIILDSSWGESPIDLESIVKAGETKTYIHLDPSDNPEYLEYDGEDGIPQCIHGDDLSKIISMKYLKDVDSSTPPSDGDVYMYDGDTNTFKTFDLKTLLGNISDTINNFRNRILNLEARIDTVETTLRKPEGAPSDAVVTWGNINLYSDSTNNNVKTSGFYTHNPSTEKTNDEYFA